jgi:anaerobic selenocysteine-containing dehydrogenase
MTRGVEEYRSVCRICHGGCAARLFVEDGRLVKVLPAEGSPFNLGQMCVKGLRTPEIMYHPQRLRYPLKRVGKRGAGQWARVSWDEALDAVAAKLDLLRGESGPECIALGQGTGRHHYFHVIRFANTLGTPNWYEPGLANCFIPRISVSRLTYGKFVVADYYGETTPRTILFWGHNPLVSNADGELSYPVKRALKAGAFGIAVDPRRSETAKRCGLWLPIRPGTDCALALAMLQVIVEQKLYDREFVENWCLGLDRLKESLNGRTPDWASEITGIPAGDIVLATRRYALEKPSILDWGVAIEQNPNSLQTVRAIALLRALTGNLDVPGGDVFGMDLIRPYPVLQHKLPEQAFKKRIGADQFKLLGGFRAFMPSAHIPGLFKAMRTDDPYRIRALLIFGNNPLLTVADSHMVHRSLEALELLVVSEFFMTPTASLADYVLPAAFWPEVNQILELPLVAGNAVFAQQKVVQVGECRQNEHTLDDLAARLGLFGSDQGLESILDYRLEPLGLTFQQLKSRFLVHPPFTYRKFEAKGFATPSRKVELYCKGLERLGYEPLPSYQEPPESPLSDPELARRYPYVLTTGARRAEFFHSEHRQIESLRQRRPDPLAELHPATASAHGIGDGDWVKVSSPRGSIRMRAKLTEDISPGVVSLDHGWWFPERGGDFGVFESNANVLTSADPPYDPAFGSYQLRGLLCALEKADLGG